MADEPRSRVFRFVVTQEVLVIAAAGVELLRPQETLLHVEAHDGSDYSSHVDAQALVRDAIMEADVGPDFDVSPGATSVTPIEELGRS